MKGVQLCHSELALKIPELKRKKSPEMKSTSTYEGLRAGARYFLLYVPLFARFTHLLRVLRLFMPLRVLRTIFKYVEHILGNE